MDGSVYVAFVVLSVYCGVIGASEILSLNKPTAQSSNYRLNDHSPIEHTSEKAVDGDTNQRLDQNSCAHQAAGNSDAWWRVDLQKQVTIDNIEIYYRDEGETGWDGWRNRFAGYEVYLSNTTERHHEDRCFGDSSQEVDGILSHVNLPGCKGTAQYVTLYNNRTGEKKYDWYSDYAYLELCEVQVYGCEVGTYGNGNCDQTCSPNCPGGLCDPTYGDCLYCGTNTYKIYGESVCRPCPDNCAGPCNSYGNCDACRVGFYGHTDCSSKCPSTCSTDTCDRTSRDCNACQDGFYGYKCGSSCSETCTNNVCEKDYGHCLKCQDGHYGHCMVTGSGPSCLIPNNRGRIPLPYSDGSQCKYRCPINCRTAVCDRDSGECTACQDGFYGYKCGFNCSETCTNNVCKKDNGHCLKCPDGRYGSRCTIPCRYNCGNNRCEQESGECTECSDGKYGPTCTNCSETCLKGLCNFSGHCSEGCVDGTHGDRCELKCPDTCGTDVCDRDSGECKDGCVDGTYGDRCELECSENCTSCTQDGKRCLGCINGTFGSSCSKTCGNCEDMRCSLETGDCDKSCITGWTGQRCDVKVKKQSQSQNEDSNIGIYAGGAGGGVVVLILLVIVIVCLIKRKSSGNSSVPSAVYGQSKSSNLTNRHTDGGQVYINLQNGYMPEEREGLDNVYCNEGPVGFLINTLKTAIAEKARDDEQKFTAEFESFPLGSMHPHTAAEKNKSKNRFKAIYPYDHSRVPLDSVSGGNDSDYINANYIDSVEERRVYVATQGPLPTTINDFWRMIWAINSGKIVMLTNLVESRKDKCAKYWPDEGDPMSTKTFHITLNRERRYASHVVRNLTVVYKKSKESREINQFHFTTWPDHGTPNTLELVLFHRRIKLCQTSLPGQLVIHCSAGIGRTGTFIALDALLDFGRKYQRIDIRHYVNTMRKDRMNMIQTQEQYVALHELLAEAFDLQDTLIPKSMFLSKYHVLSSTSQPQNQTQLRDEFQLMQNLKPTYKLEQDYMASTLPENKAKNITMRILAADRFRAFLKSYSATGNDYVNAVITQSYTDRQGYIVTQSPLPGTRADLWTLVMDYQCDTMVILGDNKNPEQDTPWIPLETSNIEIGDFKVQQRGNPTEFNGVDVTEISISKQNVKAPHSMKVFRLKEWTMDRQVPPSKQSVLHLLEQVESRRRASGNKPVLVSCRDGATQCGLFCLMANTRDQIKMDEEVDVFQAARQLLVRRPEFLSTLEQYQYCYAILNDYLEATDVYIN